MLGEWLNDYSLSELRELNPLIPNTITPRTRTPLPPVKTRERSKTDPNGGEKS